MTAASRQSTHALLARFGGGECNAIRYWTLAATLHIFLHAAREKSLPKPSTAGMGSARPALQVDQWPVRPVQDRRFRSRNVAAQSKSLSEKTSSYRLVIS